jgi:hypothetical protein
VDAPVVEHASFTRKAGEEIVDQLTTSCCTTGTWRWPR